MTYQIIKTYRRRLLRSVVDVSTEEPLEYLRSLYGRGEKLNRQNIALCLRNSY